MILVTGATGLLGNCVVRELLQRNLPVRVLVRPGRNNLPRRELAELNVEVFTGSLDDVSMIQRALEGCQAVVHSAAMIHIGYQLLRESRAVNVSGSQSIGQACLRSGCRMVYISTVDTLPAAPALDRPLSEDCVMDRVRNGAIVPSKIPCSYVISKTEAEARVLEMMEHGLDATILHPGFMLGPYDWKPSSGMLMLTLNKMPYLVAPRGSASVCDARDVAAAVVNCVLQKTREKHYILAGQNIAYAELIRQMLLVMQQSKRVIRMGPIIPLIARFYDLWIKLSGQREGLFNGAAIAMGQLHHAYDSSRAKRELGYHCRPLSESMHDAWAWIANEFVRAR